jgi:hypothetical protein
MEIKQPFVFQTDSDIVKKVYRESPNFIIRYSDDSTNREYCTIYFCSHNIYFPNSESVFMKRIVEGDFYEWYGTRIRKSYKHIFVRDIFKQWYLTGINVEINSPQKLLEFLQQETEGYKVITMGSSAGGYAAVLYGSLLKANRVMAFNPQFEVRSLLTKSDENVDPLIFRLKDTSLSEYYDLRHWIDPITVDIFCFYSTGSTWDKEQYEHTKDIAGIHRIAFSTAHHGIPFLKVCLPKVINLDKDTLLALTGRIQHPYLFSVKMAGLWNTLYGLFSQVYKAYLKNNNEK